MKKGNNFTYSKFETLFESSNFSPQIIDTSRLSSSYYGDYHEDGFEAISEIVKLWRAVISQGLSDIRSRSKRADIKDSKNRIHNMMIDSAGDKYFVEICGMARLSPQMVRGEFKRILNIK